MDNFMKTLAVIVLVLAVIGSFVIGDSFITVASGLLSASIAFGLLYSIGCALEDLRRIAVASERAAGMAPGMRPAVSAPQGNGPVAGKGLAGHSSLGLKVCPKCGEENQKNSQICIKCGASLPSQAGSASKAVQYKKCPGCGTENRGSRSMCLGCGATLFGISPTAQSKK